MININSVDDLAAAFGDAGVLAEAIGTSRNHANYMLKANSIRPQYFGRIVRAAKRRGLPVDGDVLVRLFDIDRRPTGRKR